MADIRIFADVDGTALLWRDRMLVQVRRGNLTMTNLLAITDRLAAVLATTNTHHAALMLLEPGAPVLGEAVRAAQRTLLLGMIRRKDVSSAVVVIGDGVAVNMQRTLVRMFSIGSPAFKVFAEPEPAIAWVVDELERHGVACDAAALAATLAEARRVPA